MIKFYKTSNFPRIILFSVLAIVFTIAFISLKLGYPSFDLAYGVAIWAMACIASVIFAITMYYDLIIEDNLLIVTSATSKKRFLIAKIDVTEVKIPKRGEVRFSVTIIADKIYDLNSICYTKENFKALQELLQICKKSPITMEELDEMIKHAWLPLK